MRTAHFFSLPLIAGAFLIVGAALSAPVAPDTAGNDDTAPPVDDEVEIFGQRLTSTPCDCNDPDAITGTAGLNLLVGTPGDDILCGFEGRDLLLGLRGDDCIDGGAGSDLIFGGAGADTLDGGEVLDRIFGGGGTDACRNGERTFRCDP